MTREERNSVIDEFANVLKDTKLECEQLDEEIINALQMTLPLIADSIAESLKSDMIPNGLIPVESGVKITTSDDCTVETMFLFDDENYFHLYKNYDNVDIKAKGKE